MTSGTKRARRASMADGRTKTMTKHDKIARIIGLADELGVKIDTSRKEKKHEKSVRNKDQKHRK